MGRHLPRLQSADVSRRLTKENGSGEEGLDVGEFIRFFRLLTARRDLEAVLFLHSTSRPCPPSAGPCSQVMKEWSSGNADCLEPTDLRRFLVEEQGVGFPFPVPRTDLMDR